MKITKGAKVQRKGSNVVWTINGTDEFAAGAGWEGIKRVKDTPTEVHLYCVPKNRKSKMYEWVSIDNFEKNWIEIK